MLSRDLTNLSLIVDLALESENPYNSLKGQTQLPRANTSENKYYNITNYIPNNNESLTLIKYKKKHNFTYHHIFLYGELMKETVWISIICKDN